MTGAVREFLNDGGHKWEDVAIPMQEYAMDVETYDHGSPVGYLIPKMSKEMPDPTHHNSHGWMVLRELVQGIFCLAVLKIIFIFVRGPGGPGGGSGLPFP